MATFSKCFENLYMLASSPLAHHVKRFTFWCDVLPTWHDNAEAFATWERTTLSDNLSPEADTQRHALYPLSCKKFSHKELVRGFHRFQDLRADHFGWREYAVAQAFKENFALLPNLVEVHVSRSTAAFARPNNSPVWKRFRSETLVGPEEWAITLINGMKSEQYILSAAMHLYILEAIGYRASTLGYGSTHITALDITFSDVAGMGRVEDELFSTCEPDMWITIQTGFHRLRSFKLIAERVTGSYDTALKVAQKLIDILRTAPQLKHFELQYNGTVDLSCEGSPYLPAIKPLFDQPKGKAEPMWPSIEKISLNIHPSYGKLLLFLRQFAATLRSVELRNMILDHVQVYITHLRNDLRLEHVYLEDVCNSWDRELPEYRPMFFKQGTDVNEYDERTVKAYILRERDDLGTVYLGWDFPLLNGKWPSSKRRE